jgi:hypothetical protein
MSLIENVVSPYAILYSAVQARPINSFHVMCLSKKATAFRVRGAGYESVFRVSENGETDCQ